MLFVSKLLTCLGNAMLLSVLEKIGLPKKVQTAASIDLSVFKRGGRFLDEVLVGQDDGIFNKVKG